MLPNGLVEMPSPPAPDNLGRRTHDPAVLAAVERMTAAIDRQTAVMEEFVKYAKNVMAELAKRPTTEAPKPQQQQQQGKKR